MTSYSKKNILPALILGFTSIWASPAYSACVPNDCTSLGYTKTASECSGLQAVKCPFDNSKFYCQEPLIFCMEENTQFCKEKFTCTTACYGYEKEMDYNGGPYRTSQICGQNLDLSKKWILKWCIDDCADKLYATCNLVDKLYEVDTSTSANLEGWTTTPPPAGGKGSSGGGGGSTGGSSSCYKYRNDCSMYCPCMKLWADTVNLQQAQNKIRGDENWLNCKCTGISI